MCRLKISLEMLLLLYHVSVQIENKFGDVIVIISCECADFGDVIVIISSD